MGNKATKLRKFGDEYTTYDFAHLHTDDAVRRRADENMGKQVKARLKRTRGRDLRRLKDRNQLFFV